MRRSRHHRDITQADDVRREIARPLWQAGLCFWRDHDLQHDHPRCLVPEEKVSSEANFGGGWSA